MDARRFSPGWPRFNPILAGPPQAQLVEAPQERAGNLLGRALALKHPVQDQGPGGGDLLPGEVPVGQRRGFHCQSGHVTGAGEGYRRHPHDGAAALGAVVGISPKYSAAPRADRQVLPGARL